jgi:hypothetical protein
VTTPWDELEALAVQEARLIADDRLEELPAVYERGATLVAALPQPLPSEAVEPLRRALSSQRASASMLQARRDAAAAELGRLHRGRTGVRGYARSLDVRR